MAQITYQEKLSRQFNRYVVGIVLVFFGILSLLLLLHSFFITEYENLQNSQLLSDTVTRTCRQYEEFLRSEEAQETFLARLREENSDNYTSYYFNSFALSAGVDGGLILCDEDDQIVYNSVEHDPTNLHLSYFHSLLLENLHHQGEIYHTIYQRSAEMGSYVMAVPLYDSVGRYAGAAAVYIDCSDWEEVMRQNQFDGIIVGGNDYVLAVSNSALLDGPVNRFALEESPFYTAGGQSYRQSSGTVSEYGITFYIFQHAGDLSPYYAILAIAIIILVATLLITGRSFSRRIANLNSSSVETLHNEITAIQNRQGEHRIELHTGDEFETIADHINTMLDHLEALNERNMELDRLNNQMERLQLEAQFDPHFLYNTLESIRYGVRLGDRDVDSMILKLTALLRYSINSVQTQVTLEEDLRHLQDYLDIIQYRFQSRFHYHVDIPAQCLSHPCPKLLIQPLVENSVKYGLQKRKNLTVSIRGWQDEDFLYIEVKDDGPGMEEGRLEEVRQLIQESPDQQSSHHGLKNVARRLKLQFGGGSGMELSSIPGEGTVTLLRVAHIEVAL